MGFVILILFGGSRWLFRVLGVVGLFGFLGFGSVYLLVICFDVFMCLMLWVVCVLVCWMFDL